MNIIKLWNLYADGDSQWDSLTEGEKLMFAMSIEREACCSIVYGLCESDNVAQRTVDAIRARGTT